MPSPFPGMDPYLEHPAGWPGVHFRLIATLQTALNRVIRPKYLATVEERIYLSDEPEDDRPGVRVPDVHVRTDTPSADPAGQPAQTVTAPTVLRTLRGVELKERRVEVIVPGTKQVVTVIEILSPANKRTSGKGRASFLRKKREVVRSAANWVEIDLLRAGTNTFPRPRGRPGEYAVHVSPPKMRPKGLVWAIPLPTPLPVIGVPLAAPDSDAAIDLQAVFTEAYHLGALDGLADYRADPTPPLPPDLAGWADGLLRSRGLRPASPAAPPASGPAAAG